MGKKKKSRARKILDWSITGVFGVLILAVGVFLIMGNITKGSNYNIPNFGGHQILVVLTDSMEPEYKVGTALFVDKVDPSELAEKKDITFYYPAWKEYMSNPVVTHRIRKIEIDETKKVGKGRYKITCSGINTNSGQASDISGGKTRDCTKQFQTIDETKVLGIVRGQSRFIGGLYSFATSPWGLVTLLFVPCGYLIITNVIDLYKASKTPEVEEATSAPSNESIASLSQEDKERLKKEMLNKMMEDHQNGSKQ